jgi:hypothetical protein
MTQSGSNARRSLMVPGLLAAPVVLIAVLVVAKVREITDPALWLAGPPALAAEDPYLRAADRHAGEWKRVYQTIPAAALSAWRIGPDVTGQRLTTVPKPADPPVIAAVRERRS